MLQLSYRVEWKELNCVSASLRDYNHLIVNAFYRFLALKAVNILLFTLEIVCLHSTFKKGSIAQLVQSMAPKAPGFAVREIH